MRSSLAMDARKKAGRILNHKGMQCNHMVILKKNYILAEIKRNYLKMIIDMGIHKRSLVGGHSFTFLRHKPETTPFQDSSVNVKWEVMKVFIHRVMCMIWLVSLAFASR